MIMIGKQKPKVFIGLLLILLLTGMPTVSSRAAENNGFVTQNGYVLSQKQYDKLSQIYNDDVLYLQSNETIDYWLQDDVEILPGDTLYIQIDELYDAKGKYLGEVEQEITEHEAEILEKKIEKNNSQPITRKEFTALAPLTAKVNSVNSNDTLLAYVKTNMKLLKILTSNQSSVTSKRIVLTLEWTSLPKTRSFDVIAIRPGVECSFYSNNIDKNLSCQQVYDGKTITYNPKGDHCVKKYGSSFSGGYKMNGHTHGCGFSMNLVDSATKGITCKMEMFVDTAKNNFVAYGSYQHATKNVSLAESKKYSISYEGLGRVILFDDKVKAKYDAMQGVAGVFK